MGKLMQEHPGDGSKENHKRLDNLCFQRATARGQTTFTLVEQDRSSPEVICEWIKKNINTCPSEKLYDALESAIIMRDSKTRKAAD